MSKKLFFIIVSWLVGVSLVACGPTRAELDTHVIQLTANLPAAYTPTPQPPNSFPEATTSEYLISNGAGFLVSQAEERLVAYYYISVSLKEGLPEGAYLEAHFENPLEPQTPITMGQEVAAGQQDIMFLSDEAVTGVKCRLYEIVVYVYSDSTKANLLGEHRQQIVPSFDLDKADSLQELSATC